MSTIVLEYHGGISELLFPTVGVAVLDQGYSMVFSKEMPTVVGAGFGAGLDCSESPHEKGKHS